MSAIQHNTPSLVAIEMMSAVQHNTPSLVAIETMSDVQRNTPSLAGIDAVRLRTYLHGLSVNADVLSVAIQDQYPLEITCGDEDESRKYRTKVIQRYLAANPTGSILCLVEISDDLKEIDDRNALVEQFGSHITFGFFDFHSSTVFCRLTADGDYDLVLLSDTRPASFYMYQYISALWLRDPNIYYDLRKVVSIRCYLSKFHKRCHPTRVIRWDRGHWLSTEFFAGSMYDLQTILLFLIEERRSAINKRMGKESKSWLTVDLIRVMLRPCLTRAFVTN